MKENYILIIETTRFFFFKKNELFIFNSGKAARKAAKRETKKGVRCTVYPQRVFGNKDGAGRLNIYQA